MQDSQITASTQEATQVSRQLGISKSEATLVEADAPYFEKYKAKPVQPSWGHQGAPIPYDKIVNNMDERKVEMRNIIRQIAQERERFDLNELSREYSEAQETDRASSTRSTPRRKVDQNKQQQTRVVSLDEVNRVPRDQIKGAIALK
jgi:hypothetical protein